MSYDLRIWEQPADRLPPATLEDAGRAMLALEGKRPGVNPKFVALGKEMSARFRTASREAGPADDAVWMSDPAVEAESLGDAVWVVAIPPDNRVPVTFFVVETATALGLTVLDEQLGMAFLPGGTVVPDERSTLWEGLRREMSPSNEPAVTKADMRKAMATFLREAVTRHGFEHDPANDRADVAFTRSTPAGRQTIDLKIEGAVPRLECAIYCMQRNETVESINDAALGPRAASPDSFAFNVGSFVGVFNHGLPFASMKEIKEIFALLESKALPVMEACTSLAGLNEVMNRADRYPLTYEYRHPLSPRSLAGYFHSKSPRPLIVAWLANDPRFDDLVGEYRELARKEGRSKSEEALEKLLPYLREFVRPEHEGSHPTAF